MMIRFKKKLRKEEKKRKEKKKPWDVEVNLKDKL